MGVTFFVEGEHKIDDETRQWSCTWSTAHIIVEGYLGISLKECGQLDPRTVRNAINTHIVNMMDSQHNIEPEIVYKFSKLMYLAGLALAQLKMIAYG